MNLRPLFIIALIAAFSAGSLAHNPDHLSLRLNTAVGTITASGGESASTKAAAIRAIERDTFQMINGERRIAGLPTLHWD